MFRAPVKWSPVEIDYLKINKKGPIDQLCIALNKSRSAITNKIKELDGKVPVKKKGPSFQSKVGFREDLNHFVRSGWEANMFRLFKSGLTKYINPEYEPKTFSFTEFVPPRGGALSYMPDFKVEVNNKEFYVEVKGNWLRSNDKTKLKRFKKYYPEEFKNLIAVVSTANTKTAEFFKSLGVPSEQILEYNKLKKEFSSKIKEWEP
jgi:hypothetical protein